MYFLSLRKVFIRNQSGTHDMWVPANKAVFIVAKLHQAAMAAGCVQCNEHGVVVAGIKGRDAYGRRASTGSAAG